MASKDDLRYPWRPAPILIGLGIFVALVLLPAPQGLAPEGWRVVAVAALMITWWITEAVPIPATALLPIALFPVLGATSQGAATAPYADPVIFLFMGGFILALAMERCELHRRVALNILARTGSRQPRIVGGFMFATAFLSMWVSNTATAVMMLPVAASVAELVKARGASSQFPLALMLSIAYAASIGGVATLIGTPPNALLAGALNQAYGYDIGFAQWMVLGVPIATVMLVATWLFLTHVSIRLKNAPIEGAEALFREQLESLGPWSKAEIRVGIIFLVTALAWVFRSVLDDYVPGLTDASIAILAALALFTTPSGDRGKGGALIEWYDTRRLPWDVLILFGGGLSLAAAVAATGLDVWIGGLIADYANLLPVIALVFFVSAVVLLLTEFTSNTATAATFVPLLGALAVSLGENPLLLTVPATLAASMAFMFPVATPPNALVFGSGYVTVRQMARHGFGLNILTLIVVVSLAYWLLLTFFGVSVGVLPSWAG